MTTAHAHRHEFEKLSASQILAIAGNEPERLFSGDAGALKSEFRTLSKLWHPDVSKNPQAESVFAHIYALYVKAGDKLASGTWSEPGLLRLTGRDGRVRKLRYVKEHAFELGRLYLGVGVVAFAIDKTMGGDLAINGVETIKGIAYADDKLRKEFSDKFPNLIDFFDTGTLIVSVFKKAPDMVLLADLRDHLLQSTGQSMDPKHVAWILSRLHSFACFLQVNGQTHNGISTDTVFVAPQMHTAALLGGWWYAARENTALKGLPGAALDNVPHGVLASGKATRRVDLEMIRAVGRDLLGDPTGSLILRDKKVPRPMAQWLTDASSGDAFKDFRVWSEEILKDSFGARRFTELNISFSDIYQPT